MEEKKYKLVWSQAACNHVHKLVKPRKRSYRDMKKRKFNGCVLAALKDEKETAREIEFWKRYAGTKHYDDLVGMMSAALEVANTLKSEFLKLGKSFRLADYAPYTVDIKKELFKLNQLTLL